MHTRVKTHMLQDTLSNPHHRFQVRRNTAERSYSSENLIRVRIGDTACRKIEIIIIEEKDDTLRLGMKLIRDYPTIRGIKYYFTETYRAPYTGLTQKYRFIRLTSAVRRCRIRRKTGDERKIIARENNPHSLTRPGEQLELICREIASRSMRAARPATIVAFNARYNFFTLT